MPAYPHHISTEAELDEVMTRPSAALQAFIATVHGPLVVLGAGGKMGPSLCKRARRAADAAGHDLDVIAVSRFTDARVREDLDAAGIQTVACDLMDAAALGQLPRAKNVIYLVGMKFGTGRAPARTWAVNTLIPAHTMAHYAGARIVALSTGNVYPLVPVAGGGAVESSPMTPVGEYANACVARERIFEYCAGESATPVVLVRLNYAIDLRYGVLVDIARRIQAGEPVDVTTGFLNCIWQGDANDMILRSLALAAIPPAPLNLTGPEIHSVRSLAKRLGALMDRPVRFTGEEAETALLSDPAVACARLGDPLVSIDTMLRWTAHWVEQGGALLDKPTHFEVRDGKY